VRCGACGHELYTAYFDEDLFGRGSDIAFCPLCGAVYEGGKFSYWDLDALHG